MAADADPEEPISDCVPLTESEAKVVGAIFERMFPADEWGPGATDIGVLDYVLGALADAYADQVPVYRAIVRRMNEDARTDYASWFVELAPEQQDVLIERLEQQAATGDDQERADNHFGVLFQHLREGLFCDPMHGGNRGMLGWRLIGFPGAQYGYRAEEQQIDFVIRREPRSRADLLAESAEGASVR